MNTKSWFSLRSKLHNQIDLGDPNELIWLIWIFTWSKRNRHTRFKQLLHSNGKHRSNGNVFQNPVCRGKLLSWNALDARWISRLLFAATPAGGPSTKRLVPVNAPNASHALQCWCFHIALYGMSCTISIAFTTSTPALMQVNALSVCKQNRSVSNRNFRLEVELELDREVGNGSD